MSEDRARPALLAETQQRSLATARRDQDAVETAPASAAVASRRSAVTGAFLIDGSEGAADDSHGHLHSLAIGSVWGPARLWACLIAALDSKMPDDSRAHSIYAVNHHSLRSLFWAVS